MIIPLAVLLFLAEAVYYGQKILVAWSGSGELEAMTKAGLTTAQIDKHYGQTSPAAIVGDLKTIAVVGGVGFLAWLAVKQFGHRGR